MRIHTSYSDREFKCDFQGCTKAFISASDLKNHKAYHGEKSFICDLCGKEESTKYSLQTHLRTKHGALPELELKCKHCDEVFATYRHRLWHTNLVHFPDKYRCSVCHKSHGTKQLLEVHSRFHTDRSCECPECGKTMMQEQLKIHMRLHTGDLISCSYCPWRGQTRRLLSRHIQKQHKVAWEREQESKEDSSRCKECGKFFISERALSNHVGQNHRKHRSIALPTDVHHMREGWK